MMNIVFGTLKGSRSESVAKYPEKAVITIEGAKEAGRSRRVLFNEKASEVTELENKEVQTVMFGFLTDDGNGEKAVLFANISGLPENPTNVVYKTSRNKVAFEDSKERGKAISNSNLIKDIDTLIQLGDEAKEFEIVPFDAGEEVENLGYDLFKLVEINNTTEQGTPFDEDLTADAGPVEEIEVNEEEIVENSSIEAEIVTEDDEDDIIFE